MMAQSVILMIVGLWKEDRLGDVSHARDTVTCIRDTWFASCKINRQERVRICMLPPVASSSAHPRP